MQVTRRLFFTVVVACRRRLRKAWEQTPLAKLFTLEDEWSMLKLRAQASVAIVSSGRCPS
jgi:hypothetical protein|tara:strand:+ start:548 stop:727 length:180 start_codon:yes stop_codon:yes gene_type:complete